MAGKPVKVVSASRTSSTRVLLCGLDQPIPHGTYIDLRISPLPRGTNGEVATLWGADLKVVGIPGKAVLAGELKRVFSEKIK